MDVVAELLEAELGPHFAEAGDRGMALDGILIGLVAKGVDENDLDVGDMTDWFPAPSGWTPAVTCQISGPSPALLAQWWRGCRSSRCCKGRLAGFGAGR